MTGRDAIAPDAAAVATARHAVITTKPNRSTTMYLIHEELARSRMQERREQAMVERRAYRLASARRWQRRAEASARRARAARDAVA